MVSRNTVLTSDDDPGRILGVSINASDAEIRAAYLRKVKEYPPDRAPVEFERIRDSFEILRDPRRRALLTVLRADTEAPLASLVEGNEGERLFVGPEPWLAALEERQTEPRIEEHTS